MPKTHGVPKRMFFEAALSRFEQAAVSFSQLAITKSGSPEEARASRVYEAQRKILFSMLGYD